MLHRDFERMEVLISTVILKFVLIITDNLIKKLRNI